MLAPTPENIYRNQPQQSKVKTGYLLNLLISSVLTFAIVFCFLIASEHTRHWFLLPLTATGMIVGADAIGWFRGRLDVFDPVGVIGLLLYLRAFIGSLYMMSLGGPILPSWFPPAPDDWRPWIGFMAVLDFLGILIYQFTRFIFGPKLERATTYIRTLRADRFFPLTAGFLVLTGLIQFGSFIFFGGLTGFIYAYETRAAGFSGMGIIFMVSESFPIIGMMGYAAYLKKQNVNPSWFTIAIILLAFFVLRLFFGGLRGSRSNTIWGVFWAVGIIHYWIKPVPKKMIAVGMVGMMVFVYVWGFYKAAGLDGLEAVVIEGKASEFEQKTGRTKSAAWLSGGVQPYTLYRICRDDSDYEYAWGRTYMGALAKLIPRFVWPNRPPGKVKEGTEALYGEGAYPNIVTSKVFGLAGEAMLNFGPSAVPFAFVFLGFAVGRVRRWLVGLSPDDVRWLMIPFLVNLCVVIHGGDSDNLIFFIFKNGALPFCLIYLGSIREPTIKKRLQLEKIESAHQRFKPLITPTSERRL